MRLWTAIFGLGLTLVLLLTSCTEKPTTAVPEVEVFPTGIAFLGP